MKKLFLFVLLLANICAGVFAEETETTLLKLDFPLFDLPYQTDIMDAMDYGFFNSYTSPSMAQSLAISTDMFSAFHYGMRKFNDSSKMHPILKNTIFYGGTVLGDMLLGALPPFKFITFMHEEFHKTTYSRFGVYSFNNTYTFKDLFGGGLENMNDDDLARFKKESLPDFVRQHTAGFEGENLLIDTMQKNNFFYGKERSFLTELAFVPLYWIDLIAMHAYMTNPNDPEGLGTDSPSFVYNLFRPDEPHTVQFINSSGKEVYRNPIVEDFTDQEREYFKKIGYWQFISYISPMMFGFTSLPLGNTDVRWNFSFRHFLTSFGTDITFKILLNIDRYNVIAAYHHHQNYEHTFPAIEMQLIDFPVQIGNFKMFLSPKIMVGVQPKEQNFFTSQAEFFGLIGVRGDFQVHKHLFPYVEITAKTDGWAAGNEFLEQNVKCIAGMSVRFY